MQGKKPPGVQNNSTPFQHRWIVEFSSRVRFLRQCYGWTQGQLSQAFGKSDRDAIARIERGEAKQIPVRIFGGLLDLAKKRGIRLAWLAVGVGEPFGQDEEELGRVVIQTTAVPLPDLAKSGLLINADRTDEPKYRVAKTIEPGFKIVDAEQLPPEWRGNYVPLIGRIAAGKGVDTVEAESYPAGLAAHYVEMADSPRDGFAVSVEGDSMEPDFQHGDLVVSDGHTRGRSGRVCIVLETTRAGDRLARVKRLVVRGKTAVLESANPAYQPIEVDAAAIQAYAVWRHLAIRIERQ